MARSSRILANGRQGEGAGRQDNALQHRGQLVKRPKPCISWVHKIHPQAGELRQCFFGEHLLELHKKKPVAIVESEVTAMLCSALRDDVAWLAIGSLGTMVDDKVAVLENRAVTIYPSFGNYNKFVGVAKSVGLGGAALCDELEKSKYEGKFRDIGEYLLAERAYTSSKVSDVVADACFSGIGDLTRLI